MAAADDPVPAPRSSRPGVPGQAPVAQPRTRIVLAEVSRREDRADRAERTRAELAEQTRVGDALVRGLVRAQFALALRLSLVVAIGLGGLPWLFAVAPAVGRVTVLGVNLPWLLLGVASFPFLIAVGWAYVRLAERNEQDFTDLVQRPER
ncbi:hypothetical protein OG777_12465 [Micromonospora peucetia]|uniref:DUF485 domain-containing protein n=1 Tax=Micromonospora peucetia TaxID=47871 RepID=A0ABZ1ELD5_9ACTN|nr:hypothetical protein [Micromonospora peucetia]MCX4387742.1 hypothetical protein [Micromonospora peucetia]WSA35058.1 hypothetical protein OIE14_13920 [Micromonospora peucetia]